jgi:hypothetical protein
MVYLLNTTDHTVVFHDPSRAVVEQHQLDHPNAACVIVEVASPAYAMMALREAMLGLWKHTVQPLLEKLAQYPDLGLVSYEAKLELFLDCAGIDEELAREQARQYVREQLRPSQGVNVQKVAIDLATGEEVPAIAE